MIKVIRGNPTPEELAAALAVVRARAAAAPSPSGAGRERDAWSDPSRIAGTRLPAPGPDAWSHSLRPR